MSPEELWASFIKKNKIKENPKMNVMPLGPFAKAVDNKQKTATTSAYKLYQIFMKDNFFKKSDYCVVTNEKNDAVCIIQINEIEIKKFDQIDDEYAKKENFESKQQWMEHHEKFFSTVMQNYNMTFNKDIDIICFKFEKIFGI